MKAAKLIQMLEVAASRWKQPVSQAAPDDNWAVTKEDIKELYNSELVIIKKRVESVINQFPLVNIIQLADGWIIKDYYEFYNNMDAFIKFIIDNLDQSRVVYASKVGSRIYIVIDPYTMCQLACYNATSRDSKLGIVLSFSWTTKAYNMYEKAS